MRHKASTGVKWESSTPSGRHFQNCDKAVQANCYHKRPIQGSRRSLDICLEYRHRNWLLQTDSAGRPKCGCWNITETQSELWRKQLFVTVLDSLIGELRWRFVSSESISLSKAICSTFMFDHDSIDSLLNIYGNILNIKSHIVKPEMLIAKHTFMDITNESSKSDCTVHDEDLHRIVSDSDQLRSNPNVLKMLQLAMMPPSTSASYERSFSAMRHVKNYLRTTTGRDRFSSQAYSTLNRN